MNSRVTKDKLLTLNELKTYFIYSSYFNTVWRL